MAHGLPPDLGQSHKLPRHGNPATPEPATSPYDSDALLATSHDTPIPPSPSQDHCFGRDQPSSVGSVAGLPSTASSRQSWTSPTKMVLTGDNHRRAPAPGAHHSHRNRPPAVRTTSVDTSPPRIRRSLPTTSTPSSPGLPKNSTSSRFPFFASSVSAAIKGLTSGNSAASPDEDLLTLDIEAALFPSGAPTDGDCFSPAAFKNLQMNAGGLLRRFQAAYQRRDKAFQELRAERDAQDEEQSEAETRTRHLKKQLEEMAHKADENEAIIRSLVQQLNEEKKSRMETRRTGDKRHVPSMMSAASEDLAVEEDQRRSARRSSGLTAKSDTGSDTDEDSIEVASVFSRCRSPTSTLCTLDATPSMDAAPPPPPPPPSHLKPATLGPPRTPKQSQPQMSTIQKLFKGMSSDAPKVDDQRGPYSCRNCQGQDASVAWDTASLLRIENRGLKQRVGELEEAVEEALDTVNGFRL
ncbi:hypothetical protein L249_2996 [Ophiocordyceps polyrhachis-furcata BCC 54312]|uniref:Uncharacterized protein n=1 Tax=Ophiocordyceps polyrhachis-furcata BCC 54312 TaxID=1330021 RepID=A0A367LNH3_9HYPO|nr:hypothetical protein L249_2996 [Ophiocordyceps polyrhachis-furcata BCC 54312]